MTKIMTNRNGVSTEEIGTQRGARQTTSPQRAVVKSLGEFARDAIILAELQYELFKLDFAESGRRVTRPLVVLLVALVLSLSCLPVALLGLASLLEQATNWSRWLSLLATSALGLIIAVVCGLISWRMLSRSLRKFHRSQNELQQNIRWLKYVLSGGHDETTGNAPSAASMREQSEQFDRATLNPGENI